MIWRNLGGKISQHKCHGWRAMIFTSHLPDLKYKPRAFWSFNAHEGSLELKHLGVCLLDGGQGHRSGRCGNAAPSGQTPRTGATSANL